MHLSIVRTLPSRSLAMAFLAIALPTASASAAITLPSVLEEDGRLHFFASGSLEKNEVDSFDFLIPDETIAVQFIVDGHFSEPFTDYDCALFLNYSCAGQTGWGFGSGDEQIGGLRGSPDNPLDAILPAGIWSMELFHTRPSTYSYTLEIIATQVPEPSTLVLGLPVFALIMHHRRCLRRQKPHLSFCAV